MTLLDKLIETLSANEKFTVNGKLLKNKVIEHCLKLDSELLSLIYNDEKLKDFFFEEVGDMKVFDKDKFIKFVSNKQFLPDSYTMFKNKIGLATDNEYFYENNNVVINFPYKECVLVGGQDNEDKKRKEIFWNTILAPEQVDTLLEPKLLTNFKKYELNGISEVGKIQDNDNLIIKGNNLLALESLLKRYEGRVKLIYIDPPYNTGSDGFEYNDKFNHSTWLTFMKNRLEVAKRLLSEEGVILVHIDDNEQAYLKVLMDEIFSTAPSGKSNFIQMIEIKANVGAANEYQNPFMPKNCEYGLLYAKNYDKRTYKPIWVKSKVDTAYNKIVLNPEEDFKKWKVGSVKEEFEKKFGNENKNNEDLLYKFVFENINRIFQTISPKGAGHGLKEAMEESKKSEWAVYEREELENILCYKGRMVRFYEKNIKSDNEGNIFIGTELGSLWTDIAWQGIAAEGGVTLKSAKKPEKLLKRIIEMSTEEGDIVLDYHLGSGTTCAVAHKMKRQYIGIEQMDYIETLAVQRLKNVINCDKSGVSKLVDWQGGGSFVYAELKELNKYYERIIENSNTKEDLLRSLNEILEKAALNYKVDKSKKEAMIEYINNSEINKGQEFLYELLDPNQLYLNYSEMDDKTHNISENDKRLNKLFYKEV